MSLREKTIKIDLNKQIFSVCKYKQYDNACRIHFLVYENGIEKDLTPYTAIAYFECSDGSVYSKECTIVGNKISTTLLSGVTNIVGKGNLEIAIFDANQIITTFIVGFYVESSLNADEAIESIGTPSDINNMLSFISNTLLKTDNNLRTTDKTIIGSINELYDNMDNPSGSVGDITQLTTDNKYNLVDAINELDFLMDCLIDDSVMAIDKIWSSNKINTKIVSTINSAESNKQDINDLNIKLSTIENLVDNSGIDLNNEVLSNVERINNLEKNIVNRMINQNKMMLQIQYILDQTGLDVSTSLMESVSIYDLIRVNIMVGSSNYNRGEIEEIIWFYYIRNDLNEEMKDELLLKIEEQHL